MSTTSYIAKTFQQNTVPGATYCIENMKKIKPSPK
jgi:hypothetical protein